MAHADYNCCAVCDCKMTYGGERTKEEICSDCLVRLNRVLKLDILTSSDLLTWIESSSEETLKAMLTDSYFSACYYHNAIDNAVRAKGIKLPFGGRYEAP